ncbi:hypothetical protein OVA24_08895 [Luteolibacter sp. SL250]|uniref:hypothetical protein n=1 Tax=Luteolibacter sp. SL250 TaxID=2995170 RepID=UPI0022721EF2|nr:hypothetical protein [Luteolibacter sp. SL250]WAC21500.1 hypothetical protein OVA24_08895 [Luteolibacter sp. SL250]
MIRLISISLWHRLSAGLLAAFSCCIAISEAQENGAVPAKPPGWWAEEFKEQSQPLWDKLREDGKITTVELLDLAYTGKSIEDGDAPALAARLLGRWREDPIPALRGMMAEKEPVKRAFAAATAGLLGDIRLEPDVERLLEDKAALGEFPGEWFAGDTVGEAAESAMENLLETDSERQLGRAARIGEAPWLTLRPSPSPEIKAAIEQADKRYDEALEKAEAAYRRDLAEAISPAMEIEVFLLSGMGEEKVKSTDRGWQKRLPRDRFPIAPYGSTSKILQRKRLSPDEVKALMPSLKATVGAYRANGILCHYPIHGIRVTNGDEVIFQTSICYQCMNFYIEYPGWSSGASWTGLSSKEFQEVMERLMPIPKSKPDSQAK